LLFGGVLRLHAFDYVLWIAAPCLQGCVLYYLRKRGLSSQFPMFCKYMVFQIVTDALLLIVQPISYWLYYYVYWTITAVSVLVTFALIDELFRLAFRNFSAIRNLGSSIFRWGTSVLLLGAITATLSFTHDQKLSGLSSLILAADRGARGMICLLALLLLLGARYLRIPTLSCLFGIALGFVTYTFFKVFVDSAILQHVSSAHAISQVNSIVYLSSCVLWIFYAKNGIPLPDHQLREESSMPEGRAATGQPLLEVINSMVEHSMQKWQKTQ
jgi:hypothetical protein